MSTQQADSTMPVTPTGCCPPFVPEPWDGQELSWEGKPFVKDHVTCLFHVPLNMGRKITKDMALIESAHAEGDAHLMLADEKSPWGSDIYIEVKRAVPGATMDSLSGNFLTKVFEGPYRNAPRWAQEMKQLVEGRGKRVEKLYFAYTTCPACAKAYGENYVVMFAKVASSGTA
jgi:hypothetical protein